MKIDTGFNEGELLERIIELIQNFQFNSFKVNALVTGIVHILLSFPKFDIESEYLNSYLSRMIPGILIKLGLELR